MCAVRPPRLPQNVFNGPAEAGHGSYIDSPITAGMQNAFEWQMQLAFTMPGNIDDWNGDWIGLLGNPSGGQLYVYFDAEKHLYLERQNGPHPHLGRIDGSYWQAGTSYILHAQKSGDTYGFQAYPSGAGVASDNVEFIWEDFDGFCDPVTTVGCGYDLGDEAFTGTVDHINWCSWSEDGAPTCSGTHGVEPATEMGPCDECSERMDTSKGICYALQEQCWEPCVEQHTEAGMEGYFNGGTDSQCCEDNGGCDGTYTGSRGSGSGDGPSEDCMTGCIEDCYGNDDFLNGDRWNKEQCVCLVTDCYDSRDCDDNDVAQIEGFVATGCGAEDSSYDYSYDYRDVEDIADEWDKDSAGALGLAVGVAVVAALAM